MKGVLRIIFLVGLVTYSTVSISQSIIINGGSIRSKTISPLLNGVNFIASNYAGGVYAQMIQDRGFEWNPTVNDRWFESTTGVENFVQRDTNEQVGGKYSGKMTISGFNNQEVYLFTDALNIISGKTYDCSVWLKSQSALDSLSFHIGWSATSTVVNQTYLIDQFSSTWTKYTWTFTASSTQQNVRLYTRFYGNGTVFLDSYSMIPNNTNNGIRNEIASAIKKTGVSFARYPNGFEGGTYEWKTAIGDKDQRKNQISADALIPASSFLAETPFYTDFGIDEFLTMCENLGIEPMIVLPISEVGDTNDIENAIHLLEYCNGDTTTFWGEKRKINGHPTPYNVSYWEIGNEQYNQVMPAPGSIADDGIAPFWTRANTLHYIDRLKKMSIAMKTNDPTIKIGAVGANDEHIQNTFLAVAIDTIWDALILDSAAQHINFICPHDYAPGTSANNPYLAMVSAHYTFDAAHHYTKAQILNSANPNIELCISEYAANYDFSVDLNINRKFKSALYFALLKIAYINQDIWGSCYFNFKDDAFFGLVDQKYWENGQVNETILKSGGYYVFELFDKNIGEHIVSTNVVSPMFNSPAVGWMPSQQNIDYLTPLATINTTKDTLFLIVVNSDSLNGQTTDITLDSLVWNADLLEVTTLTANDIDQINTYANPDTVHPFISIISIDTTVQTFSYFFPRHSITTIKIPLKNSGIGQLNEILQNTMLVYPNPAKDHVTISMNSFVDKTEVYFIDIFDTQGRLIHHALSNLPYVWVTNSISKGVYSIRIESKNKILTNKILVE